MVISDAKEAAELSAELGYPVSTEAMEERLQYIVGLPAHVVYASCIDDRVVGWIDVGIVHHLQSAPFGEIGGLVVGSEYRDLGIGHQLVRKAEQWILAQGVRTVLVRSQIKRERAHRFYLEQNFSRLKTSAVFTKSLEPQED